MREPINLSVQPSRSQEINLGELIRRVTWIGIVVNVALTIFKFLVGWFGNSRALIADAVHSLSDLSTDMAVIIGSHYWLRPPDEDHPYGHGRLETLITLIIGAALALVGLLMTWDAIQALRQGSFHTPSLFAAIIAALSIVSKEILYRWTLAQSKKIRSSAMAANAWHHRSDAISSIPVLITVAVTVVMPEWAFLDALGAAVVSGFILKASLDIIRPGVSELMDGGASPETAQKIREITLTTEGVLDIHDLRTRRISGNVQADLHIVLPPQMTIQEGHAIVEHVMRRLNEQIPELSDVLIHIDPWDDSSAPDHSKNYPPPEYARKS